MEELWVSGGDQVPADGVEIGGEFVRGIEAAGGDVVPAGRAEDLGVDFAFPEDREAGALGVVVEAYRARLDAMFKDKTAESLPHEKIIEKLDQVSQTFRVLIIKTNMTVPYTSVFLQLDCAYWGPDAEKGLRAKMAAAGVR